MKCVASLSVFQISKVFRWFFFCCRYSPAWQLPSGRRTFFQFDKRWNRTEADISNRGTGGRWISTWLGRIQINSTEREFSPLRCVAGCLLFVIGTDSELLFPLESISSGMGAYVLLLMPPPPDACFVRWFERSSELFTQHRMWSFQHRHASMCVIITETLVCDQRKRDSTPATFEPSIRSRSHNEIPTGCRPIVLRVWKEQWFGGCVGV